MRVTRTSKLGSSSQNGMKCLFFYTYWQTCSITRIGTKWNNVRWDMEQFWGYIIRLVSSNEGYNGISSVECCIYGIINHFTFIILGIMNWNGTSQYTDKFKDSYLPFKSSIEGYKTPIWANKNIFKVN